MLAEVVSSVRYSGLVLSANGVVSVLRVRGVVSVVSAVSGSYKVFSVRGRRKVYVPRESSEDPGIPEPALIN